MKCASSRTSAGEKFSSRSHLGINAWICGENLVASPRCSRWERCADCSAMGAWLVSSREILADQPEYGRDPARDRGREQRVAQQFFGRIAAAAAQAQAIQVTAGAKQHPRQCQRKAAGA